MIVAKARVLLLIICALRKYVFEKHSTSEWVRGVGGVRKARSHGNVTASGNTN